MKLVDMIRDVPETAVRIYLGAKVERTSKNIRLELDGRSYEVAYEVFDKASGIARSLLIRPRTLEYATDVLELRHRAEEMFLEELSGVEGLPKVLFVPGGELSAGSFYRATLPSQILDEREDVSPDFTFRLDLAKALRYDVLWIQLLSSPPVIEIAKRAKAEGIKVIYDVDDRFDVIPPENPAAEIYVRDKVEGVWEMLKLADLVTVSTPRLGMYLIEKGVEKAMVLPNMIPASAWPRRSLSPAEEVRILWAGSPTHQADLGVMAGAMRKVLDRHKGKVRFFSFGDAPPEAIGALHTVQLPFVDFMEYPEALARVGADIAVAPLEDNEFNTGKSDLKYVEYSACAYPSLLSEVGQYADLPDEAPKVLVGADEWEDALEGAIEASGAMRETGEAAKDWVLRNRCLMRSRAEPWMEVIRAATAKEAVGARS